MSLTLICFLWKQKQSHSQKHSELEAALKQSQEEIEAKKKAVTEFESMVKDLEQKVQVADAKAKVSPNISAQSYVWLITYIHAMYISYYLGENDITPCIKGF